MFLFVNLTIIVAVFFFFIDRQSSEPHNYTYQRKIIMTKTNKYFQSIMTEEIPNILARSSTFGIYMAQLGFDAVPIEALTVVERRIHRIP